MCNVWSNNTKEEYGGKKSLLLIQKQLTHVFKEQVNYSEKNANSPEKGFRPANVLKKSSFLGILGNFSEHLWVTASNNKLT